MNRSDWNRWSLLGGVVFVILYVVATLPLGRIGFLPDPQEVATFFNDDSAGLMTSGYLGTLSAGFLLWFTGSLRGFLKRARQEGGFLADIAFGGGVASSVLMAVSFTSIRALAQRAGEGTAIGPDAMTAVLDSTDLGMAVPVAFAVLVGATGLAVLRTRLLPAWFGWASVMLAIGLLLPVSYVLIPAMLLWTVVLSVWLVARGSHDPAGASRAPTL